MIYAMTSEEGQWRDDMVRCWCSRPDPGPGVAEFGFGSIGCQTVAVAWSVSSQGAGGRIQININKCVNP